MTSTTVSLSKRPPVEVTNWNELLRYTQFLCRGTEKKFKICMIDEEQEEIRIENKDEFDTNVKYAQDHGLKSLTLVVYIDDQRQFDGIYHIGKSKVELPLLKTTDFPLDKFHNLRDNVLVDKWYIPVKLDEALGICLTAAIKLAQEGKLDTHVECKQFVETVVPEAFRKLGNTQSVFSWPREIQCGIFDMIELLVDLVGTRLRHPPVPITLLNTLAATFDTNTTFSQKHKDEQLPKSRSYKLDDEEFLQTNQTQSFGWLRSFIQRFLAQNGLKHLRGQFEYIKNSNPTSTTTMEYNSLLKLFSKCHQCIDAYRYRLVFTRCIRQAIQYLLETKKTNQPLNTELVDLNETLIEICFNYEMNDEVNQLLELPSVPNQEEEIPPPMAPIIVPLEKLTIGKKTKKPDCYTQLAEDIRSLTVNNGDTERKNIKKQRTDEQTIVSMFSRQQITDDLVSSSDKRSLKRKHRREQQRHLAKKENKRANTLAIQTYDRSNPEDVLRFFAPMKAKIAGLYDDLQRATCHGNLREVLRIEEKLKLLHPFSARFIADENTPDGTAMQPGQVFRKGWILLNDGSMPWSNDDIQLINLADGIKVVQQPIVPVTAPHDRALITVDYTCTDQPGTYESKWILSYRQQTFGPMIWCSIVVGDQKVGKKPIVEMKETFEFIDVPLPACFDLSKPYQSTSSYTSPRTSFIMSRSNSISTQSEPLINTLENLISSDNESISTILSSLPTKSEDMPLIELTPAIVNNPLEQQQSSPRTSQSSHVGNSVMTNIFSVAKQASSTAKAIFHTLQAHEENPTTTTTTTQQTTLINTAHTSVDDFFEHIETNDTTTQQNSIFSNDPMQILVEMGFANRTKNQRLLKQYNNDLNKVIEILTTDINDDTDWFAHRH